MDIAAIAARVIVAVVFAIAAVAKLRDPDGLRYAMLNFRVPTQPTRLLTWLLPALEVAVASWLILMPNSPIGPAAGHALLALFTGYLTIGTLLSSNSCNCFGDLVHFTTKQAIARNVLLATLLGTTYPTTTWSIDSAALRPILGGLVVSLSTVTWSWSRWARASSRREVEIVA